MHGSFTLTASRRRAPARPYSDRRGRLSHVAVGHALVSACAAACLGRKSEAAAFAARDLKPDNPDVYLLLSEIHRSTHKAAALLQDLDAYLKLAPQGPAAPQVRKLREQVVKFMESQAKPASNR